jgi:hypothetical protein
MSEHPGQQWDAHDHEAVVHSHVHYHVTHNYRDMTGGFEHLSSEHEHEHDHAALSHSHHPHQDFDKEHSGEAHVHDHGEAVKDDRDPAAGRATQATNTTKKAAKTTKKASKKAGA